MQQKTSWTSLFWKKSGGTRFDSLLSTWFPLKMSNLTWFLGSFQSRTTQMISVSLYNLCSITTRYFAVFVIKTLWFFYKICRNYHTFTQNMLIQWVKIFLPNHKKKTKNLDICWLIFKLKLGRCPNSLINTNSWFFCLHYRHTFWTFQAGIGNVETMLFV